MSHGRQQIREAVVAALAGTATCGARVFKSRIFTFDDVPCLNVTWLSDVPLPGSTLGGVIRRLLTLIVEGRAKPQEGEDDLDDQLDTICKEVEQKLAMNRLSGLVDYMEIGPTASELSALQERPVGLVRMQWLCPYRVVANAPETIISADYP